MAEQRMSAMRLSLYILYGIILTGILLYVRFPTEKMRNYLTSMVESAIPGTECSMGQFSYGFPLKVKLDSLELKDSRGKHQIVLLENVALSPNLLGFGLQYGVTAELYQGAVSSQLQLKPKTDEFVFDEIELINVNAENAPFIQATMGTQFKGVLHYVGNYFGTWSTAGETEMQGRITLNNGLFAPRQPILTTREISLDSLEVDLNYTNSILTLTAGKHSGTQFHGEFKGSMKRASAKGIWQLEMQGSLVPQRDFVKQQPQISRMVKRLQKQYRQTALPYVVKGTVSNPNFRFGNG